VLQQHAEHEPQNWTVQQKDDIKAHLLYFCSSTVSVISYSITKGTVHIYTKNDKNSTHTITAISIILHHDCKDKKLLSNSTNKIL